MSYYYNYYIGYVKDNKIYPLGPYDSAGDLHAVLEISHSFASDLHNDFWMVQDEMASDELKKKITWNNWDGKPTLQVAYLPLKDLPTGDYIKSGFCLETDVEEYVRGDDDGWRDPETLMCNMLTPEEFAVKAAHELKNGRPRPKKNEWDEVIPAHSCKEYVYFSFPDYSCREWESFLLRKVANIFEFADVLKEAEIVILKTEG